MLSRFQKPGVLLPVLLVGLALLIAALTAISPKNEEKEAISNRSVYSVGPSGCKAWYLTLRKAGFPVKVWEKPFQNLSELPTPTTMLIIEPYTVAQSSIIFGTKEIDALLPWVEKGNTLILLDDYQRYGSNYLLHKLMLDAPEPWLSAYETTPVSAARDASAAFLKVPTALPPAERLLKSYLRQPLLSRTVRRFTRPPESQKDLSHDLLEDEQHRTAMLKIRYGQGSLILGTPADLSENNFVNGRPNDNFQFLTNVLSLEKKPVFINEFVHGYTEITDLFTYYQRKTPLGSMLVQLGLGFLFMLWLSFVRWTPKPDETRELSDNEGENNLMGFIQSLAGLYYRAHAASLVLGPQMHRIEALLKTRFRISLTEDARVRHLLVTLSDRYSSREDSPDALLETLKKAQKAIYTPPHPDGAKLSHRELLQMSRQLTLIQESLQHGQRTFAHHQ